MKIVFVLLCIYLLLLELFLLYIEWCHLQFYLISRSTVKVTSPKEGGDFSGFPITAIMVVVIGR
jgi:hypothetical protein